MEYKFDSKTVNEKFYVETGCYGEKIGMKDLYEDVKKYLDNGGKVRNIRVKWDSWGGWEKVSWSGLKRMFEKKE